MVGSSQECSITTNCDHEIQVFRGKRLMDNHDLLDIYPLCFQGFVQFLHGIVVRVMCSSHFRYGEILFFQQMQNVRIFTLFNKLAPSRSLRHYNCL
jgi:hypothetical protein